MLNEARCGKYAAKEMGDAVNRSAKLRNTVPTPAQLLAVAPAGFARYDVAQVNLACAAGLPGSEGIDLLACLATLTVWAEGVDRYTRDAIWEYRRQPERYQHHEGFFRFSALVTFLKHPRSLGIRYQRAAIGSFHFADSRDDLLHGLLTRREGTCTSLPVLFVALGRRLGYPLHLAIAKQHVLCQWVERNGSRVNLEGSNEAGAAMLPDEHYHAWPRPLTPDDLASGRYLRPLTRSEEFALFLETRGHCLADNGRFPEAAKAYAQARDVAPGWSQYKDHMQSLALLDSQGCITSGRGHASTELPGTPWEQVIMPPVAEALSL
jgi:hypothetical protein